MSSRVHGGSPQRVWAEYRRRGQKTGGPPARRAVPASAEFCSWPAAGGSASAAGASAASTGSSDSSSVLRLNQDLLSSDGPGDPAGPAVSRVRSYVLHTVGEVSREIHKPIKSNYDVILVQNWSCNPARTGCPKTQWLCCSLYLTYSCVIQTLFINADILIQNQVFFSNQSCRNEFLAVLDGNFLKALLANTNLKAAFL